MGSGWPRGATLLAWAALAAWAPAAAGQAAGADEADRLLARGRAELALGEGHRFLALDRFRTAAHLRPEDPAPHYWIGRTGLELLGADGEAIARQGLERAIALDPHYQDAWDRWLMLYRGPRERAHMVELLRAHGTDPRVRARIARLLVEDGACEAADTLLEAFVLRNGDPRWTAWRAECAFRLGEDGRGHRLYARAVAAAAADSTGSLWAQVAGIARPAERALYRATPPAGRPAFFRAFWAHRDPNLLTRENERIGEHFRRLAEARRRFPLRQPLALYHHSAEYRRMVSMLGAAGTPALFDLEPRVLAPGRNLPDRLDDRGLVFLRHGDPDHRDAFSMDRESWRYDGEPPLHLRFARVLGPAPMTDMVFRPAGPGGVDAVARAMTMDRSSLPAPLAFGFWLARFRAHAGPGRAELVLIPQAARAAAALFDGAGRPMARAQAPPGPLALEAPAGEYLLALDVARGDSLGRYRGRVELPGFAGPGPELSDIVLARGELRQDAGRDAVLARALPGLEVAAGAPFTLYLEAYGLARRADGKARYRVEYEWLAAEGFLARLWPGRRRIVLRYERTVAPAADGRVTHAVAVRPGRLPPGEYTLTVRVRDLVAAGAVARRSMRVVLRR